LFTIRRPKCEGTWGNEHNTIVLPAAKPFLKRYLRKRSETISVHAPLNEALFPALRDKGDGYLSTNGIEELKAIA
jgi:hypothetical protein